MKRFRVEITCMGGTVDLREADTVEGLLAAAEEVFPRYLLSGGGVGWHATDNSRADLDWNDRWKNGLDEETNEALETLFDSARRAGRAA